jgi:hypothetical protein
VQVLDGRDRPIDGAELKEHFEKDFVVAQSGPDWNCARWGCRRHG